MGMNGTDSANNPARVPKIPSAEDVFKAREGGHIETEEARYLNPEYINYYSGPAMNPTGTRFVARKQPELKDN